MTADARPFVSLPDPLDPPDPRPPVHDELKAALALLELGDRLRGMGDLADIASTAARICGHALGADTSGYGVVDGTAESVHITRDWRRDERTPTIAGTFLFADFGSFIDDMKRGDVVAIADVALDPRTAPRLATFAPFGIRGLLNVPLMSDGQLAGVFTVHHGEPREWTDEEIGFVHGVADRTWAAIATARAVEELRTVNSSLEREVQHRTADRNLLWRLSRDLMLVARFDGEITAVNPAWAQVLGWTEHELIGTSFLDLVHPDDRARTREAALALQHGGIDPTFDNRYRHRDGSMRWISWSATSGDGLIVAAGRDVTEGKKQAESLRLTEEALRQSQKLEAIGQLTGGVAHDFNNVLAVIKSGIDLLRRAELTEQQRARFMDTIGNAVTRATRLTGQLLAFARRQALQPVVFDARANTRAVNEMVGALAGAQIRIELQLADEPCYVNADPNQFDTALVNLAVNARDAMDGCGSLTIRVARAEGIPADASQAAAAGDFVAVSVADDGVGIAPEHLGRIFEPFFTTKGVGLGTGLGLSQVFGFANQSGGDVRVQTAPGRGSTFTLYLPRAVQPARQAPASDAGMPALVHGEGACVLVVEDNAELATSVEHMLRHLGYDVAVAHSGEDALALLDVSPDKFDVVFSDVVMAGMSGIDLGRTLARVYPALPVVLTSGYSYVLAQRTDHGFALLRKPYSLDDLSQVLQRALHRDRGPTPAGRAASSAAGTALASRPEPGPEVVREQRRLAELDAMHIMDSAEEAVFDGLTRLAAAFCKTPIALISLIDDHRQWFKSKVGVKVSETPRELAFCAHAIQQPEQMLVVSDATRDERFAANPFVTGDPGVRFYAGVPLVTSSGHALGTLCVVDHVPRALDPRQMDILQFLAGQVTDRLEARRRELGMAASADAP